MPDIWKDIALTLGGAVFLERCPAIAKAMLTAAAATLPKPYNERWQHDWLNDLEHVEGSMSKLCFAAWTCLNLPSLRTSYGLPAISMEMTASLLARVNLLAGAVAIGADFAMNGLSAKASPHFIQLFTPILWLTYVSGFALFLQWYWTRPTRRPLASLAAILAMLIGIVFFSPNVVILQITRHGMSVEYAVVPIVLSLIAMELGVSKRTGEREAQLRELLQGRQRLLEAKRKAAEL